MVVADYPAAVAGCRPGCGCRTCRLLAAAGAAHADAGATDDDGDAAAENAASDAVCADAYQDIACDGYACCSATYSHYDANHAAADIDAAAHSDGHARYPAWRSSRGRRRYPVGHCL